MKQARETASDAEGRNAMFEIKGKFNTAICFAKVVEEEAIEQVRRMCDYGFVDSH